MEHYEIERIRVDHSGLFTDLFEVCATARCRESGSQPWRLALRCEDLPKAGPGDRAFSLTWTTATEEAAGKAEGTYQERRMTEDAAIGVCAASFAVLDEGEITEVTQHGTGVDYWVDDRRAVLEVSGIRTGASADLNARHREKVQQLQSGSLFRSGKPGYVFVVQFGSKSARLDFHRPPGR